MQTIELQGHVGADGVLKLEVPVGIVERDVDVVLVVHPKPSATREDRGWSPGFFEETAGSLADDPTFMRHNQGEYEVRESLE